jgi:hypothetical protein
MLARRFFQAAAVPFLFLFIETTLREALPTDAAVAATASMA